MGCHVGNGCIGYELTSDLDFDPDGSGSIDAGDEYWNEGAGWEPIGSAENPFDAQFEGNGHMIASLYVNRPGQDAIGLFGAGGEAGAISNVGLSAVDIHGWDHFGGLTGINQGSIRWSYGAGDLTGAVGVGGLAGENSGVIAGGYFDGDVSGSSAVGGLVGNNAGEIKSSYVVGSVSGESGVGGLTGENSGAISGSYTTSSVSGASGVGGLAGIGEGSFSASYWDTDTTGQLTSAAGIGKTTRELQFPTGYTGIYAHWNLDLGGDGDTSAGSPWEFGTCVDYPVLQVDYNGDGKATWQEFGGQHPRTGQDFPPKFAPGEVPGLTTVMSRGRVTLEWENPCDGSISGYQYRQSADGGQTWSPDWTDMAKSDANTTSHRVPKLPVGEIYTF